MSLPCLTLLLPQALKGREGWIGGALAVLALLLLAMYGLKRLPHLRRARRHLTLTPFQLKELLMGPMPLIVDLRDEASFLRDGHISGALHMPMDKLEGHAEEVLRQARAERGEGDLFSSRHSSQGTAQRRAIVLVDENDRLAHQAADLLKDRGADWVYVLMDGFKGWRKAGYKVTK